jgi:hypothetical protein
MAFTEDLLSSMVLELTGGYQITIHPEGEKSAPGKVIDFTPPFKRMPMIKTLEERLGVTFPKDLENDAGMAFLTALAKVRPPASCAQAGVAWPACMLCSAVPCSAVPCPAVPCPACFASTAGQPHLAARGPRKPAAISSGTSQPR